jgi:starch-binding outer membrane protein, SusD/RagB family
MRTLLAGAFVVMATTSGCDDFLVKPPQGSLNELTLMNRAGVNATLVGAYRMIGGIGGDHGRESAATNWIYATVPSDDGYTGSEPGDQIAINALELYQWSGAGPHGELNLKWRDTYEGISRANATIRLLERVVTDRPAEIPAAEANSIRGQALFLRAHYHFEAWRFWKSIPYYTETDTDVRKANDGDAIPLILADLDQAISLLPESRPADKGRVFRTSAMAYKGRVQVHAGDWAGALATLRAVKALEGDAGRGFALEPNFHRVWTGFQAWANGMETILAYQASANDGDPNGNNAGHGERLAFPHGGPFGCCGFNQPSQNLVNFFQVDAATGLPLAIVSPATWNTRNENLTAGASVPVDPRLDWTVGRDGVPYKDWGPHAPGWIRDPGFAGPYSPKKYVHEQSSGAQSQVGWVPSQLNSVNRHIFRYADMLLLLAEAEIEAGTADNARLIVNQIRARAGAAAQGPGTGEGDISVPINDARITWANYQVGQYTTPWAKDDAARARVRAERRLELAYEGHRLFDLQRWGILEEVLNNYVAVERNRRGYLATASPVTSRFLRFPIPQRQIDLSHVDGQSRLTQNPGW